jgi:16S rRNA (cytosine1402-N4)-methyltransferase
MTLAHQPVLLTEVMAALQPANDHLYIDGTFGRGGYSRTILKAANTHVIAIDRDPTAIESGRAFAAEFAPRFQIMAGCFGDMASLIPAELHGRVHGIALDLGVSSPQLDEPARGFSFQQDGPLDMRMSQSGQSAADFINTAGEKEIADIIYLYGEEKRSRHVARAIVAERVSKKFERTGHLAEVIARVVPRAVDGLHPATRTFQALRLHINDELGELERGLRAATAILAQQGRLAVVSFHSLEDRIVKKFFRDHSTRAPQPSRHTPQTTEKVPLFIEITTKPITPSDEEVRLNPRARSAKLRVVEKIPPFPCPTKGDAP